MKGGSRESGEQTVETTVVSPEDEEELSRRQGGGKGLFSARTGELPDGEAGSLVSQ